MKSKVISFICCLLYSITAPVFSQPSKDSCLEDSTIIMAVEKIEIYYAAWKTRYIKMLTEEEFRNEKSCTKIKKISGKDTIGCLLYKLSIVNMKEIINVPYEDTRVIIDFYMKDGSIEKIAIGRRLQIYWRHRIYRNSELLRFIQKILPEMGDFF